MHIRWLFRLDAFRQEIKFDSLDKNYSTAKKVRQWA